MLIFNWTLMHRDTLKSKLAQEYDQAISRGYQLGYSMGQLEKSNYSVKGMLGLIARLEQETDRLVPQAFRDAFEEEK